MANPEHLRIVKHGAELLNRWRVEYRIITLDLSGANLSRADLKDADLNHTNLIRADLTGSHLSRANFNGADLAVADLRGARVQGATFRGANLIYANLTGVDLSGIDLSGVDFGGANLSEANLNNANLRDTHLRGAQLRDAALTGADLTGADLTGADLSMAEMGSTSFGHNDLSQVKGLESVRHYGRTFLGINTIYRSRGNIPEVFLRGCGVPESFIVQIPALAAATQPIQFYSCFLSYSSADQEFAGRLHADLQAKGVRVWFAPRDLPIGARIRSTIDESIRVSDKLLLVLSEASAASQWVEQEVETALRKERQGGGTVLFPVRLDDTVLEAGEGWPALVKDTRHVGDFTRWKEHDLYRKAFDRLLRDLKAGA